MSWILATIVSTGAIGELPVVKEEEVSVSSIEVCRAIIDQHSSLYTRNNWNISYHRGDNSELHVINMNRTTKIIFVCKEKK
ncbi:hypothetical protein RVBP21_2960 [Pseudomonas phage BRkr]|nr:hypothetical protein RVBP21_2960 [Pseudomonas phage BRkr]